MSLGAPERGTLPYPTFAHQVLDMRRFMIAAALLSLLTPVTAQAQFPRIMVGGGLSSPTGTFSDFADAGLHGRLGAQFGVPTSTLRIRVDGEYHTFDQQEGQPDFDVLSGAVSFVFPLGGVGLSPYLLAGVGQYRVDADPGEPFTDSGYQLGFGVDIGALGFGGFVEFRYVQILNAGDDFQYFPLSVGFRL